MYSFVKFSGLEHVTLLLMLSTPSPTNLFHKLTVTVIIRFSISSTDLVFSHSYLKSFNDQGIALTALHHLTFACPSSLISPSISKHPLKIQYVLPGPAPSTCSLLVTNLLHNFVLNVPFFKHTSSASLISKFISFNTSAPLAPPKKIFLLNSLILPSTLLSAPAPEQRHSYFCAHAHPFKKLLCCLYYVCPSHCLQSLWYIWALLRMEHNLFITVLFTIITQVGSQKVLWKSLFNE